MKIPEVCWTERFEMEKERVGFRQREIEEFFAVPCMLMTIVATHVVTQIKPKIAHPNCFHHGTGSIMGFTPSFLE